MVCSALCTDCQKCMDVSSTIRRMAAARHGKRWSNPPGTWGPRSVVLTATLDGSRNSTSRLAMLSDPYTRACPEHHPAHLLSSFPTHHFLFSLPFSCYQSHSSHGLLPFAPSPHHKRPEPGLRAPGQYKHHTKITGDSHQQTYWPWHWIWNAENKTQT